MEKTFVSLLKVAKLYWPYFFLMWIFPVIFLVGGSIADKAGHGWAFFRYFAMPLFFIGFLISGVPFFRKKISQLQLSLLVGVVPFLLWVFLVYFRLGVIKIFG
jgi:hypothetical protein